MTFREAAWGEEVVVFRFEALCFGAIRRPLHGWGRDDGECSQ